MPRDTVLTDTRLPAESRHKEKRNQRGKEEQKTREETISRVAAVGRNARMILPVTRNVIVKKNISENTL